MNRNIPTEISQNHRYLLAALSGFLLGLFFVALILRAAQPRPVDNGIFNRAQTEWKKDVYAKKYNEAVQKHLLELQKESEPASAPAKKAKVSAYSCGGLVTEEEIKMNCPSLKKYPNGRTSTGTTPRPYITVACDRANIGRKFEIEGIGQVTCEDTGGAINGAGRFDLYVNDVHEARKWGVQELAYSIVEE